METTQGAPATEPPAPRAHAAPQPHLRGWTAGCSLAAALVHLLVSPEHFEEWWGYGLFFFFAGFAQALFAILILLQPWRYHPALGARPHADRDTRRFYAAGIAGNAILVLLYLVTRTVGVPLLGPGAGEVEPVTAAGAAAKLFELATIGLLITLHRRMNRPSAWG